MPRRARPPAAPSLAGADWLIRRETQAVLAAIERGGFSARIVGGAVRNALMGERVRDIDIATTAHPGEVQALAAAAGLHVVPTGLQHGTVTVIADHVPFEVTTLREDVETFGRHAKVAFTSDWAADARRRDFTINALYCDAAGRVHDPLGGYPDLEARRVRFIGSAVDRIREDYLRILRFFRFTAEYAPGDPDAEGLLAAMRERGGLAKLSGERVHGEILRLLVAPRGVAAVAAMAEAGLLQTVLGLVPRVGRLTRLAGIEVALAVPPDGIGRLAALAIETPEDAQRLRERLRLSNEEAGRLVPVARDGFAALPLADAAHIKHAIYRHGPAAAREAMLLAWARAGDPPDDEARRAAYALATTWTPPSLPVRGADLLALGVPHGPGIGQILKAFEGWWIEAGFPDDAALLADRLATLAKSFSPTR